MNNVQTFGNLANPFHKNVYILYIKQLRLLCIIFSNSANLFKRVKITPNK